VNNREKTTVSRLLACRLSQVTRTQTLREPRVVGDFSTRHNSVKVRVLRVPPSRALEGIDLCPYQLREGSVYDLEPQVAKVLIVWKYAERVSPRRRGAKPKK